LGIILKVQDCHELAGLHKKGGKIADLFVLELDHLVVTADNLITFILGCFEELWQSKPLPGHLVSIIGIYELVIVDAVWGVSLYSLNCGFAAVQCEDVVDESLSGFAERQRLRRIGMPVFRCGGLADLEVLARC